MEPACNKNTWHQLAQHSLIVLCTIYAVVGFCATFVNHEGRNTQYSWQSGAMRVLASATLCQS